MSIIELPAYYQVEAVLNGKRKYQLYNISTKIAVDIKDIRFEDCKLIALEIATESSNKRISINVPEGYDEEDYYNSVKTYYEYNNSLYCPFELVIRKENNTSIYNERKPDEYLKDLLIHNLGKIEDISSIQKIKRITGLSVEELDKINNSYHENLTITIGRKNLAFIDYSDIKIEKSNNIDYIEQLVNKYKDNLIFIDNELYIKTMGPMLESQYGIYTKPLLSNSTFDKVDNKNQINSENIFPYSFIEHFQKDVANRRYQDSIIFQGKHHNFLKNHLIIVDTEKLYEITEPFFGKILFSYFNECFKKIITNVNNHKNITASQYGLSEINPWFSYIYHNIETGPIFIEKYQNCIKENYDIHIVKDMIDFFIKFHNQQNDKNVISIFNLQKYLDPKVPGKRTKDDKLIISSLPLISHNMKRYLTYFTLEQKKKLPNIIGRDIISNRTSFEHTEEIDLVMIPNLDFI